MKPILLILTVLLLLPSCRSAKEEYNKGKYESAIKKSLKDLRSEKKSRESKSIYNKALVKYETNILKDYKRTNTVERKESIYIKMNYLIDFYNEGSEFLDTSNVRRNKEMVNISDAVRAEIIDDYFQRGRSNLDLAFEKDDKSLAQSAYNDFYTLRQKYNPDIADLDLLLEEALTKAMMVFIFKIDVNFNIMERNEIERQFSQLEGSSGFTTVYVNRGPKEVDCVIELDFERLQEGQSTRSEKRDFQKKVEDGYTIEKDDKGNEVRVPKYKTISGSVTTKTIRYTLLWDVSSDVQPMSRHCQKYGQNFSKERYQDVISYETYGDINAIPIEYRNKNSQRFDRRNLLNDLIDDLYDEVRRHYL